MTLIKTPQEIAEKLLQSIERSGANYVALHNHMVAAIEADRAQRDLDVLVAEALMDRSRQGLDDSLEARVAAQRLLSGDTGSCQHWEEHIGPMLDALTDCLDSPLEFGVTPTTADEQLILDLWKALQVAKEGDGPAGAGYDVRDALIDQLMKAAGIRAVAGELESQP